jgi:hypothetical protein
LGWIWIWHEVLSNHLLLPWLQRHYLTTASKERISERFMCLCRATTNKQCTCSLAYLAPTFGIILAPFIFPFGSWNEVWR